MQSHYLFQSSYRFWQMSSKFKLSEKQEMIQQSVDPQLISQFSSRPIEKMNIDLIQNQLIGVFAYFNDFQIKKQQKHNFMIDRFLENKVLTQLQLLNQNEIQVQFPRNIENIQLLGDLQIFGLNIKRDENKYINDYHYERNNNQLIFQEKVEYKQQIKSRNQKLKEQLLENAKDEVYQLPFLNRQVEKVFKMMGRKYEPPETEDITENFAKGYSNFKKQMFNNIDDHILIEDYLVKCDPLKIDDDFQKDFYMIIRSERSFYGKQAVSVKNYQNFQITDIDFLCGGNPPSYLKSYLN